MYRGHRSKAVQHPATYFPMKFQRKVHRVLFITCMLPLLPCMFDWVVCSTLISLRPLYYTLDIYSKYCQDRVTLLAITGSCIMVDQGLRQSPSVRGFCDELCGVSTGPIQDSEHHNRCSFLPKPLHSYQAGSRDRKMTANLWRIANTHTQYIHHDYRS